MDRIVKVSRVFRIIFMLVFILVPLFSIISWIIAPSALQLGTNAFDMQYSPIPMDLHTIVLTPGIKLLAFFVDILVVGPNMLLLFFLIRLFGNYQREKIFTAENVKLIRNVGYTLFIWQIMTPIHQMLLSLVLTMHNPPGQHILEASFGSTNLAVLLIAFIVILISWVMGVGHQLQEEQEYTV